MNYKYGIIYTVLSVLISQSLANPFTRFNEWLQRFHIIFKDDIDDNQVYENWYQNDKHIKLVNNQNLTYTLDHNQYSGMNSSEFSQLMGFKHIEKSASNRFLQNDYEILDLSFLPSSIDWTAKGAVTAVKDQGQCGSCWSFSTTGALEGAYYVKYGTLVSFSEQQLVDCDNGLRLNHGCNGGLMDSAFDWISSNNGLCSESAYPYVSGTSTTAGSCQKSCSQVTGSKINKHVDITPNSDTSMMTALSQQPVSIAIEADQKDFQLYKSGVFTGVCSTNLDHGVLVVGYGADNGLDFYKVKNSWGSSWGEDGYIKLGRGSQYNDGSGQCGILMEASYPVL
jgi:KDEL-tailed cysteine endopeptidase